MIYSAPSAEVPIFEWNDYDLMILHGVAIDCAWLPIDAWLTLRCILVRRQPFVKGMFRAP
jgi:hypothetical protein